MPRTGRPKGEKFRVPCVHCGTVVERYPCQMARNTTGRVFCSKACRDTVGCKPRRKKDVACGQCGAVFYPASGGPNRFCSKACHDAWQGRNGVVRTCEVCGKEYRRSPSLAAASANRWCSNHCLGQSRSKRALDRQHNGKHVLLTEHGYVKLWEPDHPNGHRGRVLEHRLVVEQVLGRYLTAEEHVHHKNGDRADNRPENLEIMSNRDHGMLTGYDRALREKQSRDELEEYRRRFGPLG